MTSHPTTVDTTLDAIDQVIGTIPGPAGAGQADQPTGGCQQCGRSLGESVSDDFCSENCQILWQAEHLGVPVADTMPEGEARPNEDVPEQLPERPLTWLGPPPADLRPGHDVLDDVTVFLSRFSVFPDQHCAPTLALWYAHTHAVRQFYVTPRLILDSAEPGSGKTRVLEVAQFLVANPEMTFSSTTAALFRLIADKPVTILFDEVDAIFNPKNGGNNEDLRAMLNAGYKRSAYVLRCVGDAKAMKVDRFPVYAPAVLAGIAGHMPSTITTRAVTIHMRRRRPTDPVEAFNERLVARQARPVRDMLAAWVASVADKLADAMPEMPDGVTDRPAEIWEPLLAIADAAGGRWPDTARAACRHFVLDTGPQVTSVGVRLLASVREVFAASQTDRMSTRDLLAALVEAEGSPWADLYGKPLDARRLSVELGRYGVKPVTFTGPDGKQSKGYVTHETTGAQAQSGLTDAWSRYLPTATDESQQTGDADQ